MVRDDKLALLKGVPLFEHCSRSELIAIATLTAEVSVPAGGKLTTEGEWGREFYVLIDGTADVRRKGRLINKLGAGDFLGEILLIADRPRTATVTATAPIHLLVITASDFRKLMREVPHIQAKILDALAERLPDEES